MDLTLLNALRELANGRECKLEGYAIDRNLTFRNVFMLKDINNVMLAHFCVERNYINLRYNTGRSIGLGGDKLYLNLLERIAPQWT